MKLGNWYKYCAALIVLPLVGCSGGPQWKQASGQAADVPNQDVPFAQYVEQSRMSIERIIARLRIKGGNSPYIGGYTSEQVAQMRGPFELLPSVDVDCTAQNSGAGKGFLFIHGLTDSPYLLRNLADSLADVYPCSRSRAILLPGHGTVVGDSVNMRYQQWLAITDYGVRSLQQLSEIKEIYLVGFSTGTALSIRQLKEGTSTDKIAGLVMLSTAVKAKSELAWAAVYLRWFKDWVSDNQEIDAARYSSFSANAGAEFYQLTKGLNSQDYQINLPVLMAVSSDDQTIDAAAARSFYCQYTHSERRKLIWYQGVLNNNAPGCTGIETVSGEGIEKVYQGAKYAYASLSHTGISGSPADTHYGIGGEYRDCKSYEGSANQDDFRGCLDNINTVLYGEKNNASRAEELGLNYFSRATFNPYYKGLVDNVACFVDRHCAIANVDASRQ